MLCSFGISTEASAPAVLSLNNVFRAVVTQKLIGTPTHQYFTCKALGGCSFLALKREYYNHEHKFSSEGSRAKERKCTFTLLHIMINNDWWVHVVHDVTHVHSMWLCNNYGIIGPNQTRLHLWPFQQKEYVALIRVLLWPCADWAAWLE